MRIVMTGATAGFGLFAASRMADAGHNLVVGARSPDTPPAELAGRASFLPLDLDSLTSVRAFVEALGPQPVDRLVLNAGLQSSRPAVSADGFERTFAVNHLAHFLLLDLLVVQAVKKSAPLPAMQSSRQTILEATVAVAVAVAVVANKMSLVKTSWMTNLIFLEH